MLGRRAHGQHPPRSTSLPALPACPQLRPYQRRALAHMLREERAEGGASRHLWVKLNLPNEPGGWAGWAGNASLSASQQTAGPLTVL